MPTFLRLIKQDLFASCHALVPPEPYYDNCLFDACGCDLGGDCTCYCEAIETYVHQCTSRGVTINWRVKTDECREFRNNLFYFHFILRYCTMLRLLL